MSATTPVLDTDILSQIQTVLMEPPDGGVTIPSGLWTSAELQNRLNERSNRFLKGTRILVGTSAPIPVTAGQSRFDLPQDWLTTLSVIWDGQDGTSTELVRVDSFEADHGASPWETTRSSPTFYMDEDAPLLSIVIGPSPRVNGTLTLLYVPQGGTMGTGGGPIALPEIYAAGGLKYGTLADLFGKDGRGANPEKAQYCELRYTLDVQLAEIMLRGWA